MLTEMCGELETLLRRTKEIICDESALADVTVKGRANFVTRCDTEVQAFLQGELARRWPDVQFLGEEGSRADIDPAGRVLYNPFLNEMFTAVRGAGARCNGRPIRASAAPGLSRSVIAVGTSPYEREYADANFRAFRRIFDRCEDIRRTGSAALDLAYVAAGRVEGYLERNLKPWDFAAGILLVAEAGGRVSDYGGGAPYPLANADVVAAAPAVFDELFAAAAERGR